MQIRPGVLALVRRSSASNSAVPSVGSSASSSVSGLAKIRDSIFDPSIASPSKAGSAKHGPRIVNIKLSTSNRLD